MYNATNAATWLWAPQRFATRLRVLRRASIQLNDLFVNLLSHRGALQRNASQFNSAPRYAAQRFVCYNASPRGSALHWAPRLPAAHRASTQLNDLFVTPRRNVAYSIAALFNSTQRFVCQFIIAPRHGSRQRTAAQLGLPRRAATQRNELKLN
jgi:hypothetical protein